MALLRNLIENLVKQILPQAPATHVEPRKLFEGRVCWIGDTRVSDCCRRYHRALVIERDGVLYPALHHLTMDGTEEVTICAAARDMTAARRQAHALLPK
ncbi:hypothetical protein H8Z72_23425 (plasmid) [Xanthomonas citri pv. citri]|uniref:hypothetical protein n=1 Tax=Xanthomonas citri TaxID=346 RepID=UPI0019337E46|nr:hypothetical protein [Xanthomonas citri]QRD62734.1 hypothetical protein H8Z74_22760 [Xanthomonas citri pv. citri]QRD67061.1 hypothetical protein H8Z73_22845 [Xanthomonas citri pv. citri]QRD71686.1 hypothetical protein H8Z72_23425 [Xanthomonas citri pv. citri]